MFILAGIIILGGARYTIFTERKEDEKHVKSKTDDNGKYNESDNDDSEEDNVGCKHHSGYENGY